MPSVNSFSRPRTHSVSARRSARWYSDSIRKSRGSPAPPGLEPGLVLGVGRLERVEPLPQQVGQLAGDSTAHSARAASNLVYSRSGSLISSRSQSASSARPASVIW